MPAKKTQITDAARTKNMRALARRGQGSDDRNVLERAVQAVGRCRDEAPKPSAAKK